MDVVEGTAEHLDLRLAGVARSRIDVADVERTVRSATTRQRQCRRLRTRSAPPAPQCDPGPPAAHPDATPGPAARRSADDSSRRARDHRKDLAGRRKPSRSSRKPPPGPREARPDDRLRGCPESISPVEIRKLMDSGRARCTRAPGMTAKIALATVPSRRCQGLWQPCGGFLAGVVFKSFTLNRTFPFLRSPREPGGRVRKPSG